MPFESAKRPTPSGPSASATKPPITAVGTNSARRCLDHFRISAAARKTSASRTIDRATSFAVHIPQPLRAEQSSVAWSGSRSPIKSAVQSPDAALAPRPSAPDHAPRLSPATAGVPAQSSGGANYGLGLRGSDECEHAPRGIGGVGKLQLLE